MHKGRTHTFGDIEGFKHFNLNLITNLLNGINAKFL